MSGTTPRRSRRAAVVVWLVGLGVAVAIVWQARFTADLSAFLPTKPTPEQAILIDQLREGPASHLVLIAIESPTDRADRHALARWSSSLAATLRRDPNFLSISNGNSTNGDADRRMLFEHRYLLSDRTRPERFTTAGLHDAVVETLDLLSSSAGLMLQPLIARDPTAELVHLVDAFAGGRDLPTVDGAWVATDRVGTHALLVAETRAAGSDIDGQALAVDALKRAFDAVRAAEPATAATPRLLLSGLPVFAVDSRATIEREAGLLSATGLVLVALLLGFVYRSATALVLGLVPMASGALCGLAVVALGFGLVHGITLGFGVTLIGEAVDYAIYLFVQRPDRRRGDERFWRTIALGVATSAIGFGALLFSGFDGLAQIGLLSIVGLAVAAAVTRWVLPALMPTRFEVRSMPRAGDRLRDTCDAARRLRIPVVALAVAACVVLWWHRERLWSRDLSSLSSFSQAQQDLDERLRGALGAPDVRDLVVVEASDQQSALVGSEAVAAALAPFVDAGSLAGIESPSRYLPSDAVQRRRQAALPDDPTLRRNFEQALAGLPFNDGGFDGFFADVAREKAGPLLRRKDLEASSLAPALRALLTSHAGPEGRPRWTAVTALRTPPGGDLPRERIRAAIATIDATTTGDPAATIRHVDIRDETQNLYAGYLGEAVRMATIGAVAIVALLALALRDGDRFVRVVAPLTIAVVLVAAGHVVDGSALNLFHLVGLLLIVGVGSNYALFFDRRAHGAGAGDAVGDDRRLLTSLVVANLTAVIGFGVLGLSSLNVLKAIGTTVAPGAFLALWLAAVFARTPRGAA